MEIRTEHLLPCPHCGSINLQGPHLREYCGDHRSPHWWIECKECPCGMELPSETAIVIVEAWNRRYDGETNELRSLVNDARRALRAWYDAEYYGGSYEIAQQLRDSFLNNERVLEITKKGSK